MLSREEIRQILAQSQTKASQNTIELQPGQEKKIWFENEELEEEKLSNDSKPYYMAMLMNMAGEEAELSLLDGQNCKVIKYRKPRFTLPISKLMEYSLKSEEGLQDMVEIDELNNATLLYNLFKRYEKDEIYTYVGPILLAMNPFKMIAGIYSDELIAKYAKQILNAEFPHEAKRELPPHIFALTAMAKKQMLESKKKQAIVISGESGAGKTESAKQAMKFLTQMNKFVDGGQSGSDAHDGIEQKILECNPVLEAFGNAKTERNNNSSRFGKYVKLVFGKKYGEIQGAITSNYLLEKSRVTSPESKERNYHIFYHLLRSQNNQLLSKLFLLDKNGNPLDYTDFNYLKLGSDVDQRAVNDYDCFVELDGKFTDLGFSEEEQKYVWNMTAACLHIGQLQFNDATYDENGVPCSIVNQEVMKCICELLGVGNPENLVQEIVNKPAAPGINIRAPLKKKDCEENRDSLSKALYNQLFCWLVKRMNKTIIPAFMLPEGDINEKENTCTIGLLDIFGFEKFVLNKFEQLCINYVNEKLHKLYIHAIFDAEKIELKAQGLEDRIESLKEPDDTAPRVISILDQKQMLNQKDAKIGIFYLIDDCSNQKPRPTYNILLDKIKKNHADNSKFEIDLKKRDTKFFTIKHSAKDVKYSVETFIEKNVDELSSSLEKVLVEKTHPIVGQIYSNSVPEIDQGEEQEESPKKGGAAPKKKTIWSKFSIQMQELMEELAEPLLDFKKVTQEVEEGKAKSKAQQALENIEPCELHFIRCIKPNDEKVPDHFVHSMALQQITYMGVLESIDLKQKNFPFRKSFEEFYSRFELLSSRYGQERYYQMDKFRTDFQQLSKEILVKTLQGECDEHFAVGSTKILMKNEVIAVLEKAKLKAKKDKDDAARHVKRCFSLFLGNTRVKQNKKKALKVEKGLKLKFNQLMEDRAVIFKQQAVEAILSYKTEKRKDYETKAAKVLADVYKKKVFRDKLAASIRGRQKVIQSINNYATIMRLRKYCISYFTVQGMVKNAFDTGRKNEQKKSVFTVQRIFRGFKRRQGDQEVVKKALIAKENLKLNVAAKKVQKYLRGRIVLSRFARLEYTAAKIQGYFRMKWYQQVFKTIRSDVMVLQRGARRYLARRDQIRERMRTYLSQELNTLQKVRAIEQFQLFGDQEMTQQILPTIKQQTPYSVRKIGLITKVADLHVLVDLSEIYQLSWSQQWLKVNKEIHGQDSSVLSLSIGQTHSVAVSSKSKVYCWGWNDQGQCAKDTDKVDYVELKTVAKTGLVDDFPPDLKIRQCISTDDRTLLLDTEGNLFAWGANDKGQLGLGDYEDHFKPKKLKNLKNVVSINCGGDMNLACNEEGEAFTWPLILNGVKQSTPQKIPFSDKVKVISVSTGQNFGFFLTNQGLVYSFGKDNSEGQLGLGHNFPRDIPELISSLKEAGERVDALECGFKHAIAKTSLGKVYTWGWGIHGQLGHGSQDSHLSPCLVALEKNKHKEKVIQIAAGYSHSVVMLDATREILWFGTNSGSLNKTMRPIPMKLQEIMPDLFPESSAVSFSQGQQLDYAVIKVNCSWSKTMSVTSVVVADLRPFNQESANLKSQHQKIVNFLQTVTTKWEPRILLPPYIPVIAGFFSANMMPVPKETQSNGSNTKNGAIKGKKKM